MENKGRKGFGAGTLLLFAAVVLLSCCALRAALRGFTSSVTTEGQGGVINRLLGLGAGQPMEPLPLAGPVQPPRQGAYLGFYYPPGPFLISRIDRFDRLSERNNRIVMWYQPWAPQNRYRFDPGACAAVLRRGKIPMITWEPWNPGGNANLLRNPARQPRYRLSLIVNGEFDAYIRSWARGIRAVGGPVMLRPLHEMNGDWYPWGGTVNGNTPPEFKAAWRHIHQIFRQEKATNVTWVWSINHESVPDSRANSYAAYYPGDRYVDWTAISGFNWGTSSPYSSWRTFLHWYRPPLRYLRTLHKPIVIAEFASVEQGGDKAAWLTDAYRHIRTYPEVKAVIYYNAREAAFTSTQDWRITTSDESLASFRRAIASPYFLGGRPKTLSGWFDSLDPDDRDTLLWFPRVYRP